MSLYVTLCHARRQADIARRIAWDALGPDSQPYLALVDVVTLLDAEILRCERLHGHGPRPLPGTIPGT